MKYIILLTTLLISSCTTFFNEDPNSATNIVLKETEKKELICGSDQFFINSQPHTKEILLKVLNQRNLDAYALMASAVLLELYYSPHAVSQSSTFDVVIKANSKSQYSRYASLKTDNLFL